MGKGDKRTKRGKIFAHSYGTTRHRPVPKKAKTPPIPENNVEEKQ